MKERMSLSEVRNLSYAEFSKICIQIFTSDIALKGIACVPCTEDHYLYDDPDSRACISMRLWCKHLSLFATRPDGKWLISSHIERPTISATIEEAYRQFRSIVPYISDSTADPISYEKIHNIISGEGLTDFHKFLSYIVRTHVADPKGEFIIRDVVEYTGLTIYKVRKFIKLFRDRGYIIYSPKHRSWSFVRTLELKLCNVDTFAKELYMVWFNITNLDEEDN